ncbi:MAG: DUF58 domain-containing protein [Pseudohongiella sp.]|nr:DUF58 domain-containing protein [Pseudohongiella sp.]
MAFSFREQLNKNYRRWISKNIPPRDKVTLNRKNIFILPTRHGLLFVLATALIFIYAINYATSLAFGLTFLMVSIFILAILHCFNNLNQLTLASKSSPPVFCGEEASFKVHLSRSTNKTHEALEFNFPDSNSSYADLVTRDLEDIEVFTLANKRGEFKAPRLRVQTLFPLGLCRAWSVLDLNLSCLVYPKPVPFVMDQFDSGASGPDESTISRKGSEEFYGLRNYVAGDSMRSVAWKNVAKGQGMQVKQFVDYVDRNVWLDWDMLYGFNVEERLSRLCYCVLKLAKTGNPFGLKIPGTEIEPDTGPEHRRKLLKALALFGVD